MLIWNCNTSDGGYIITGWTRTYGSNGDVYVWLIKTDASGNELWNKTLGGVGRVPGTVGIYGGRSVQQTRDEGYIIAWQGYSPFEVSLIKTDSNGNKLWDSNFYDGTGGGMGIHDVKQAKDGGYIVTGYRNHYTGGNAGNGTDLWLAKTDNNGNKIWEKTSHESGFEEGRSVQPTSDGGYIVVGSRNSLQDDSSYGRQFGNEEFDFTQQREAVWLIKTDASSNELWRKTFGEYGDEGRSVQQTSDGGYIITGWTRTYGDNGDVWLIKADASGNELWNKTFGGSGWDEGRSVQQTSDGGYIITGSTSPQMLPLGKFDVLLIKTDSSGNADV